MILDKIIRNIYPSVVNISLKTDGVYSATDAMGNNVALDTSLINAEYDSKQYARNRAEAYPSIADQLDDIYHNGVAGWKTSIKAVKDQYPKT